MTDYTVDGKHVKAVQYKGDLGAVEETFPNLTVLTDGNGDTFFDRNNERSYFTEGDWIVLAGPKYSVESDLTPDKPAAKATTTDKDK